MQHYKKKLAASMTEYSVSIQKNLLHIARWAGLEKSAVRSSRTSRFYFWANNLIGNGSGKSWICQLHVNQQKSKLRAAQDKQTLRASTATCPKGKLGFPLIALMRGNSFTLAFFCFTLNLFSDLFPITIKTSNHYKSIYDKVPLV